MQCHYFEADLCRSCSWIEKPYSQQVQEKEQRCRTLLPTIPQEAWLPTQTSAQSGFRNKAKLAAGGRGSDLTLGLNTLDGGNQDLRDCPLYTPAMRQLIADIIAWLNHLGISPYDLHTRNGELKYVIITEGDAGRYSLRLVVRSHRWLPRLRQQIPVLQREFPEVVLASVNIHPEHCATLAGEEEQVLFGDYLPVRFGEVSLLATPSSFLQTNTGVAHALYTQATRWLKALEVESVLDLYCGVGGFALSAARAGIRAHGVELDESAVRAAQRAADEQGLRATFTTSDATAAFRQLIDTGEGVQALVVNPPRRGIGAQLANQVNTAGPDYLIYSSCNPASFAKDLEILDRYRPVRIRCFDMFPHTGHVETVCLMTRKER